MAGDTTETHDVGWSESMHRRLQVGGNRQSGSSDANPRPKTGKVI